MFLADITFAKVFIQYNMCFSTFVESDTTYINAKDMYHICINNSVPNSLLLDSNNCIITGPNAAGKSTFIKGLVLNIILSQTYGIANASSFDITPFYYINTQINIPDAKGKESLFEAEMHRCKHNVDIIKYLPNPSYKGFVVMDEVFSSTNVVEGIAGAYGILQKLSTFSNICTIVTTHFPYLTKLPSYIKFKMNVDISNEQIITYPYLLTKGVSKQLIALELIKNNFDEDIIDTALLIKKKLLV
jgi:DNA mismatch repair protein MutS